MSINIEEQGVYNAGGIVQQTEGKFDPINGQLADAGQLRHSDHASVFYQIPANGNNKRVMFLHGYGGSKATWLSTPYCKGIADMFLENGYATYLVDQPRRGAAGQGSVDYTISARPDELTWWTQFRLGLWPDFQAGTMFPTDADSIEQFFRFMTPNTGPFDMSIITEALYVALEKSGPATLITHSQGGMPGWMIGCNSENVTGIIAIEPGNFIMPEDELPDALPSKSVFAANGKMNCVPVPLEQFERLTKKPIVVYFGDYIPSEPSEVPALDHWRVVLELAHKFADCVNRHGGDAEIVHLPDEGIKGNSHFLFQEKNNAEIFQHIQHWMNERNL